MALSTEEKVLLDHLLEKQREENANRPPRAPGGDRKLYVFKLLDKSSSMDSYKQVTIDTYNESLDALRESEVDTFVTLIEFNAEAKITKRAQPLAQAERLTGRTYNPSGMTAIYDAIGLAFELAQTLESDYNTSFLLEVITDGEENKSSKYNAHTVKALIDAHKMTGQWTVTVMGPHGSVDLFKRLGVDVGNIATFNPNSNESRGLTKSVLRSSTANYVRSVNLSSGAVASSSTYSSVIGTNSVDDYKGA